MGDQQGGNLQDRECGIGGQRRGLRSGSLDAGGGATDLHAVGRSLHGSQRPRGRSAYHHVSSTDPAHPPDQEEPRVGGERAQWGGGVGI